MCLHDCHLVKYEALRKGETINLHLIYGYRNAAKDWSSIAFTKIALDNFTQVSGTIATEIDEVPIAKNASRNRR